MTVFPGLVTDITATCGTTSGLAFPASPVPPATTGFGDITPGKQGLLVDNTTGACASSMNNNTYDSAGWTGGTWRWGQAFYYNTAYPAGALITGSAGNSLFVYSASATDNVRIRFAAVTDSATYTFSTNSVSFLAGTSTTTAKAPDLSSLSVTVPPGGKFAIVFDWTGNLTSTNTHRVGLDGYTYALSPVINVNVNGAPSAPAITAPSAGSNQSGTVNITWSASTDPDGSPVHYDVYGSINNGATYPYIIAKNVSGTSTTWNTVADQIGMNAAATGVRIRVEAGDGYFHTPGTMGGSFTVDNHSSDAVAPGAITNLGAATLTKIGGVRLAWTAPGDDNYAGQASRYDIRYNTQAITDNARFAAATIADNTMVPKPAGSAESYEVTGLAAGTTYFFAVKTADEVPNWSAVSNSPSAAAGANCGVCHASPPNSAAARGSHDKHGSAQVDCAKCHGTAASTYTTAHSDGGLQLGFRTATPDNLAYPPSQLQVTFLQSTRTIYQDNSGGGGVDWFTGSDDVDNGTCMSFNQAGVNATGCHASATPVWGNPASGACGTCHGTVGRTGYLDTSGDVDGAPPKDLAGAASGTNVGKHLEHVNVSYYYTGDSCRLCHNGAGKGTVLHADGTLQFSFHSAAGASAAYDGVSHTCSGLAAGCHPALTWDSAGNPACTVCHTGFASHTKSNRTTGACTDCHPGGSRVGFTRKHSLNGGTSGIVLIPRPPSSWGDPSGRLMGTNMQTRLGIDYGSMGGIHLGGDLTSGVTEAEICWNCHVNAANNVSEWGFNTKTTPTGFPVVLNTTPANFPTQHDGTADRVNNGWIWNSSYAAKVPDWTAGYWMNEYDNAIRNRVTSVHYGLLRSGRAVLERGEQRRRPRARSTGRLPILENKSYIRCSYCHDVHDLNKAQGDTTTGKPFLRGTWVGNPYPPELPPRIAIPYTTRVNVTGANVPCGDTTRTRAATSSTRTATGPRTTPR